MNNGAVAKTETLRHFDQEELYGLRVLGCSHSPRFEPGELICVSPVSDVSPGDDVAVRLLDQSGMCPSRPLVARLVSKNDCEVVLRQFNPDMTFSVPASKIQSVHRVMTSNDLLAG